MAASPRAAASLRSYTALSVPHARAFSEGLFGPQADVAQQVASQYFTMFVLNNSATLHWDFWWNTMGRWSSSQGSGAFGSAAAFQRALWWYNGAMGAGVMAMPPLMSVSQILKASPSAFGAGVAALRGVWGGTPNPGHAGAHPVGDTPRAVPVLFVCGADDSAILCNRSYALRTASMVRGNYTNLAVAGCGHDLLSCPRAADTQKVVGAILLHLENAGAGAEQEEEIVAWYDATGKYPQCSEGPATYMRQCQFHSDLFAFVPAGRPVWAAPGETCASLGFEYIGPERVFTGMRPYFRGGVPAWTAYNTQFHKGHPDVETILNNTRDWNPACRAAAPSISKTTTLPPARRSNGTGAVYFDAGKVWPGCVEGVLDYLETCYKASNLLAYMLSGRPQLSAVGPAYDCAALGYERVDAADPVFPGVGLFWKGGSASFDRFWSEFQVSHPNISAFLAQARDENPHCAGAGWGGVASRQQWHQAAAAAGDRAVGVCNSSSCGTESGKCPQCCDDCGLPSRPDCNAACVHCAWC